MTAPDTQTPRLEGTKLELYTRLLEILSEYQLPGGKLDGHSLMTDLATAKRFRDGAYVFKSDLDEALGLLNILRHGKHVDDREPLTTFERIDAFVARLALQERHSL